MLDELLGRDAQTITWWQMALRAIVVFAYLVLLVRVGGRRMLARFSAYDVVVMVLLGSTLSRALTGNAPLGPTLVASGALVLLHDLIARIAVRRPGFARYLDGKEKQLIRDGECLTDAMRRSAITDADLHEAMRSNAGTDDVGEIRAAYLERSGMISFLRR